MEFAFVFLHNLLNAIPKHTVDITKAFFLKKKFNGLLSRLMIVY